MRAFIRRCEISCPALARLQRDDPATASSVLGGYAAGPSPIQCAYSDGERSGFLSLDVSGSTTTVETSATRSRGRELARAKSFRACRDRCLWAPTMAITPVAAPKNAAHS